MNCIPRLYWVGLYLVDRRYGGPEEGGWYYSAGELVKDAKTYSLLCSPPRSFFDEEEAIKYCQLMNMQAKTLNECRPPMASVLSQGRYQAEVFEDALPDFFPEQTPHFE